MSKAYAAGGKRRSSMTHARRGATCEICDQEIYGNGGKVTHGRAHVRAGEAAELVKFHPDGPLRFFLPVDDVEQIARLRALGYDD